MAHRELITALARDLREQTGLFKQAPASPAEDPTMSRFAEGYINVTNVDMRAFVLAVYELSKPQGLGWLTAAPGALGDDVLAQIMADYEANLRARDLIALLLDYVQGRSCKMTVWRDDDQLYIVDGWYDHTRDQFAELLHRFSLTPMAFEGA